MQNQISNAEWYPLGHRQPVLRITHVCRDRDELRNRPNKTSSRSQNPIHPSEGPRGRPTSKEQQWSIQLVTNAWTRTTVASWWGSGRTFEADEIGHSSFMQLSLHVERKSRVTPRWQMEGKVKWERTVKAVVTQPNYMSMYEVFKNTLAYMFIIM